MSTLSLSDRGIQYLCLDLHLYGIFIYCISNDRQSNESHAGGAVTAWIMVAVMRMPLGTRLSWAAQLGMWSATSSFFANKLSTGGRGGGGDGRISQPRKAFYSLLF